MTLFAVGSENAQAKLSFGVSDDPSELLRSFEGAGGFPDTGNRSVSIAAHGAAAVSTTIPGNSTVTLSIVFAWHFPHRDFSGTILGNNYANVWADSVAVATELADEQVGLRRTQQ